MACSFHDHLATLTDTNGKLALELVYAEPGKDNGLLPINCLLSQMEDLAAATPPPTPIQQALLLARQWIDEVFDTTGNFNVQVLKRLGEWTAWLENALESLVSDREPSAFPPGWQEQSIGSEPETPGKKTSVPAASAGDAFEDMPLTMNLEQDGELLREFISESLEHLQNIELGVLVLEENPANTETLASIFRAFHTFKGGSGLLNLKPVNRLAHELESLLDLARQHKLVINKPIIDLILEGGDVLKQFTTEIEKQLSGERPSYPVVIPTQNLLIRVRGVIQGVSGEKSTTGAAPSSPISILPAKKSDEATSQPEGLTAIQNVAQPGSATPQSETAASNTGAQGPQSGHQANNSMVVKVATYKLDNLIDLVGEMVIAQSLVAQDPTLRAITDGGLMRNMAQLGRITNELQKTAMSLRMVPIRSTFQKMNRLVRDIAMRQGKQVGLVLHGEDTELDRTIVEQLNDPLVHMIRNAVDHGIEKPEVRLARGKPAEGIIHLKAGHQGGSIMIEIKDDGGGLNKERILAKAISQGMINADDSLTEDEIFHLIFAPGFSTAEVVTDVSGRGVGMDVVRRNIEQLRGKIEIQSQVGEGSTFTIFLPLTLAIIDGLMVSVGEQRYLLPSLLVRESFRPTAGMISTIYERGEMVNVRGRLLPLLRLYEYFGLTPHSTDPLQSVVVVVGSGNENRCLLVDQLLGKQEVVIKSLGETFKQTRALAGAAILGDGRVGLILDVDYLAKLKGEAFKKAA